MKLAECKMGVLVSVQPDALATDELRIGHVVGLTYAGIVPDGQPYTHSVAVLETIRRPKDVESVKKMRVIPLILFAGNSHPTPFDYEKLDLFTAY